jgi:two-component system sensor histidine kinase/response regulator
MSKVLIIDDDLYLRQTIREVLFENGFEVYEAQNGLDGLQQAKEMIPDLILCDYVMQDMNGHETLAALREESKTAAIPLILMTGSPDLACMRSTMNLGADDYLTKPFTMLTLLQAVEARCKKQDVIKRKAEEKLSGLRQNISLMLPHELNTPLTGILGFAELITSSAATLTPPEITEMAQDIFNAGKRLQRLINNFLIFSQIEMLRSDPKEVEEFRKDKVNDAASIIEVIAKETAKKHERFNDLKIISKPVSARISTDLLKKIAEEVIDNACKFSPPGTPIEVFVGIINGSFHLTIKDQGRGINSDQISEVGAFVQFQRKIHEQQGSGLGLIIARGLTEIHAGKFSIESQNGHGTKITISLPS